MMVSVSLDWQRFLGRIFLKCWNSEAVAAKCHLQQPVLRALCRCVPTLSLWSCGRVSWFGGERELH